MGDSPVNQQGPIKPDPLDFGNAATLDPTKHPSGGDLPNPSRPSDVEMRWTAAGSPMVRDAGKAPTAPSSLPMTIAPQDIADAVDRYGENSSKFWSGKK